MATTTNYAWETPDDTDLVKDGAAAIRTLGSSIDTTTKALNPSTTLGDIEYRSGTANTNTRLGIGTSGQVLAVSGGGVPEWTTAAGGGANWVLENAGGTALTGAATITISGISGKDKIMVLLSGASSASGSSEISLRFNSDSGSNYYYFGSIVITESAYANTIFSRANGGAGIDRCKIIKMSNSASTIINAYHLTSGANSSGVKVYNYSSGTSAGGANAEVYSAGGYYNSSSAISSVSVVSSSGDFDAGTVFVYTSA